MKFNFLFLFFIYCNCNSFGQCVMGDCNNGYGKYVFSSGASYEGEFKSGKYSGKGVYTYEDKSMHAGTWIDGSHVGYGFTQEADGKIIEGNWDGLTFKARSVTITNDNREKYSVRFFLNSINSRNTESSTSKIINSSPQNQDQDLVKLRAEIARNNMARSQNNEKRKTLKLRTVSDDKIDRDECKSIIKKMSDAKKRKSANDISSGLVDKLKSQLCRCILQGESFSKGIWGLGDEFKEIQADNGIYGLDGLNYLKPYEGIEKGKDGKWIYPDRSFYEGDIDNELPNGRGKRTFNDGSFYEGNFAGGYFYGNGKLILADGTVQEGLWYKDMLNGKAKETFKNGAFFEGYFIDDERQINGTYKWPNGDVYLGDFYNGKSNGFGKITFAAGGYYEGDWLNDKRDGKGKYVFANGTIYEGSFYDDKFNGKGKLTTLNGDVFEGDFIDQQLNGECLISLKNGDVLQGIYNSYTEKGTGKIKYANGELYEGEWNKFLKEGSGVFESNSGFVFKGNWSSDKKNGKILCYKKNNYANRTELDYKNDIPREDYTKVWNNDKLVFDGNPNGYGKIYMDEGLYSGNVKDTKPYGQGKLELASGDRIEGTWAGLGMIQGRGMFVSKDGTIIEGNFVESKMQGSCKVTYVNGDVLTGVMVSSNLDGFAVLNRSDGSIVKGDFKDNDFIRNSNYSDSREEMKAKAEAEQKRSVVQQNGSKNNTSSNAKNGFDYTVFKPWDRVPVRPERYALWVSMLTERDFLMKYNVLENPSIPNIKNCMAKYNYAINNIPAEFVDDVAEDLQKIIIATYNGQLDQYMGNTSRSSSAPPSNSSNCSTESRDYVFVCDDCGKILIQQSSPFDDSFCPETRWGGVGKSGTLWDKGDHSYTKIGKSGACTFTCTGCKISLRLEGEPISKGTCGASGSNCCSHYWKKG